MEARFHLNYLRKYENQKDDVTVDFDSDWTGPFKIGDYRQVKSQLQKMDKAILLIKNIQLRLLDKERVYHSTWDVRLYYSWNELGSVQARAKVQRTSRAIESTIHSPYQNLIYRFTYLGVDNYDGGVAAAELLIKELGTEGDVAILTGVPGAFNLEERIRGFKDGIAGTDIEIITTVACNDDISLGVQVVEETMLAYPDIDGWFFVGMWPIIADQGAMPLFEEAALEGDLKVVAFDTLPVELEWVQAGLLHGLVGQKYWGWGHDTMVMAFNHVLNNYPYADWIDSGMDIVTINNVDAMAEAWANADFTEPLPPAYPD